MSNTEQSATHSVLFSFLMKKSVYPGVSAGGSLTRLAMFGDHSVCILGPREWPTMINRSEMPFTCAFIQEVQRYNPPVPMSVTHITNTDIEFEGYHIPKGTKVIWTKYIQLRSFFIVLKKRRTLLLLNMDFIKPLQKFYHILEIILPFFML